MSAESTDIQGFLQRYNSLNERASRRFLREFAYELRDPYVEICRSLGEGRPFAFSRFGDGELNAVFGVDGSTCDGHRYFPELGQRLREIVEASPDYLMGLQPLAILVHGIEQIRSLGGESPWVFAGALHRASMEGRLDVFFEALVGRDVLLVGAPHHRGLAQRWSWRYIEVPYGDCWPQYESLRAQLAEPAGSDGQVFLLCASMTANVLVDDLHALNPRNTYIDAGSVFDPYVGVNSRNYHEFLDLSRSARG